MSMVGPVTDEVLKVGEAPAQCYLHQGDGQRQPQDIDAATEEISDTGGAGLPGRLAQPEQHGQQHQRVDEEIEHEPQMVPRDIAFRVHAIEHLTVKRQVVA